MIQKALTNKARLEYHRLDLKVRLTFVFTSVCFSSNRCASFSLSISTRFNELQIESSWGGGAGVEPYLETGAGADGNGTCASRQCNLISLRLSSSSFRLSLFS